VQELPPVPVRQEDGAVVAYETKRIPPIPFSLDYPFITTNEEEEEEDLETDNNEALEDPIVAAASVGK
jgi:hypothetical protein